MERINKENQKITGGIDRRSFISKTSLAALGTLGTAGTDLIMQQGTEKETTRASRSPDTGT